MVKSENSAVIYQKNKPFSRIYRARDFIFLRHLFRFNDKTYIIDKSIEDSQYPPFVTIVRGHITNIWMIYERENRHHLVGYLQMLNEGYLN